MTNVSDIRKLLEALKTILPAMNDAEIAQIANVIYSAADRMEKEDESSNPPPMI